MTILKPVKVFTHTDLDGVGSGLIFQTLYNKDNVSVTYCDYKDINDIVKKFLKTDLSKWSKIFITDISVNEEVAELIQNIYQESFNHFVLLDHHGTATWLNKYEWALVQETFDRDGNTHKTSGTSLIIDWFRKQKEHVIPPKVEEFAEEVRKYDTWEWFNHYKEQAPKELNDYLYMIGRQSFADKMYNILRGSLKTKDYFFDENAKVLLLQRQKEIKAFIDKKESQMIVNKNKVGIVFAEDHVSELGNELCNRNPGIDYVAILDLGSGKISFRTSKDDIDVSKISKIFGGGGHPKASGAQINPELIKTFIDMF